ncbi:MAG: aquaporin [Myxococcota bacterium]|nr:aquaporin [Myxococcota bacterium]
MRPALVAEAIGTFALVLVGTGAIVVDDHTGGALGVVGVALAFGLVVTAMIHAVGDVSGAHLNPAVSVGFWLAGRLPGRRLGPYVTSQLVGAGAASVLLRLAFPAHPTLGATVAAVPAPVAVGVEGVLTFLLMFVILGVSTGAKEKGILAGVAVGATVALGALVGGPLTGASMNPARSLGPALVSGTLGGAWLYVLAPLLGAALAVGGCRGVREPGCCARGVACAPAADA